MAQAAAPVYLSWGFWIFAVAALALFVMVLLLLLTGVWSKWAALAVGAVALLGLGGFALEATGEKLSDWFWMLATVEFVRPWWLLLGAMLAVYATHGLGVSFGGWLAVHGVTELFAITLAGAGGFRIGLIAFAERASLLCPLTSDYRCFEEELGRASLETLRLRGDPGADDGTQLALALRRAERAIDPNTAKYTDVLLISDGDDMAKDTLSAAEALGKMGVQFVQGFYFARPQPLNVSSHRPQAGGTTSGARL